MVERKVTITNIKGLHLAAANELVKTASAFESDVRLRMDDMEVDAKSIMALLTLAASIGKEVTVSADGRDEDMALLAVVGLIEAKFDEPE